MKTRPPDKHGACKQSKSQRKVVDEKSVGVHKPLKGRRFFLDIHGYKGAAAFERDIKLLGGTVEKCFSKEVHILITKVGSPKDYEKSKNKDEGSGGGAASSPAPSPFNLATYRSVDSPQRPDSPVDAPVKPVITRGQAIALKAQTSKNYGSGNTLDNARRWNIRITHIDHAQKYVSKEVDKINPKNRYTDKNVSSTHQSSNKTSSHKVKRLRGRFVKFESVTRHYRPVVHQYPEFPAIYTDSAPGLCPFDRPKAGPNAGTTCGEDIERAEREERDIKGQDEDNEGLNQLEVDTGNTGDLGSPQDPTTGGSRDRGTAKTQDREMGKTRNREAVGSKEPAATPSTKTRSKESTTPQAKTRAGAAAAAAIATKSKDTHKQRVIAGGNKQSKQKPESNKKQCASSGYEPPKLYTKGELRRIMLDKIRAEQKRGYCEACEVKYDDIDKHVRSDQHKKFSRNNSNYRTLDALINQGPNMTQFLNDVLKYQEQHQHEAQVEGHGEVFLTPKVRKCHKNQTKSGEKGSLKKTSKARSPRGLSKEEKLDVPVSPRHSQRKRPCSVLEHTPKGKPKKIEFSTPKLVKNCVRPSPRLLRKTKVKGDEHTPEKSPKLEGISTPNAAGSTTKQTRDASPKLTRNSPKQRGKASNVKNSPKPCARNNSTNSPKSSVNCAAKNSPKSLAKLESHTSPERCRSPSPPAKASPFKDDSSKASPVFKSKVRKKKSLIAASELKGLLECQWTAIQEQSRRSAVNSPRTQKPVDTPRKVKMNCSIGSQDVVRSPCKSYCSASPQKVKDSQQRAKSHSQKLEHSDALEENTDKTKSQTVMNNPNPSKAKVVVSGSSWKEESLDSPKKVEVRNIIHQEQTQDDPDKNKELKQGKVGILENPCKDVVRNSRSSRRKLKVDGVGVVTVVKRSAEMSENVGSDNVQVRKTFEKNKKILEGESTTSNSNMKQLRRRMCQIKKVNESLRRSQRLRQHVVPLEDDVLVVEKEEEPDSPVLTCPRLDQPDASPEHITVGSIAEEAAASDIVEMDGVSLLPVDDVEEEVVSPSKTYTCRHLSPMSPWDRRSPRLMGKSSPRLMISPLATDTKTERNTTAKRSLTVRSTGAVGELEDMHKQRTLNSPATSSNDICSPLVGAHAPDSRALLSKTASPQKQHDGSSHLDVLSKKENPTKASASPIKKMPSTPKKMVNGAGGSPARPSLTPTKPCLLKDRLRSPLKHVTFHEGTEEQIVRRVSRKRGRMQGKSPASTSSASSGQTADIHATDPHQTAVGTVCKRHSEHVLEVTASHQGRACKLHLRDNSGFPLPPQQNQSGAQPKPRPDLDQPPTRSKRTQSKERVRLKAPWKIASNRSLSQIFDSEGEEEFVGFNSTGSNMELRTDMSFEEVSEVDLEQDWVIEHNEIITPRALPDGDIMEVVPPSENSGEVVTASPIVLPQVTEWCPPQKADEVPKHVEDIHLADIVADSALPRSEGSEGWDTTIDSYIIKCINNSKKKAPFPRKSKGRSPLSVLDPWQCAGDGETFWISSPKKKGHFVLSPKKVSGPQMASTPNRERTIVGMKHRLLQPGEQKVDEDIVFNFCSPQKSENDKGNYPQSYTVRKNLDLTDVRRSPRKHKDSIRSPTSQGRKSVVCLKRPKMTSPGASTREMDYKKLCKKYRKLSASSLKGTPPKQAVKSPGGILSSPDMDTSKHVVPRLTPNSKLELLLEKQQQVRAVSRKPKRPVKRLQTGRKVPEGKKSNKRNRPARKNMQSINGPQADKHTNKYDPYHYE